jgi:hypothetical protein
MAPLLFREAYSWGKWRRRMAIASLSLLFYAGLLYGPYTAMNEFNREAVQKYIIKLE